MLPYMSMLCGEIKAELLCIYVILFSFSQQFIHRLELLIYICAFVLTPDLKWRAFVLRKPNPILFLDTPKSEYTPDSILKTNSRFSWLKTSFCKTNAFLYFSFVFDFWWIWFETRKNRWKRIWIRFINHLTNPT